MSWEQERRDRLAGPQKVGDVIDAVLSRIGGGRRPPLLTIREAWGDVAGARWRDVSRPVEVAGESVIVEVRDGATASVMRFELAHLERRIQEIVPTAGVRKLTLRVTSRPWPPEAL